MDQTLISLLLAQFGVGGAGGFALGLVLRRITSLVVGAISFLFVAALVLLGGLTKIGIRVVSPETTEKFIAGVMQTAMHSLVSASATALPFGGSFSLGFCAGLLVGRPQSWI
jgi:uncharacterized membrane protein (Fun14 family)